MTSYNTNWHLEDRIWSAIRDKIYSGNEEHVRTLKARLTTTLDEPEELQVHTRRRIENLRYEPGYVQSVRLVVNERFIGFLRAIERDLNTGGLSEIYNPKDSSFLAKDLKSRMVDLSRYGGLLLLLDRNDSTVDEVKNLLDDVAILMVIYHNIRYEHDLFGRDGNYRSYRSATEEIEKIRVGIQPRKSSFAQDLTNHVLAYSHCVDAALLFQFINTLRSEDIANQVIDLQQLESRRVQIRRYLDVLKEKIRFNYLGPQVTKFFWGEVTVEHYVQNPR